MYPPRRCGTLEPDPSSQSRGTRRDGGAMRAITLVLSSIVAIVIVAASAQPTAAQRGGGAALFDSLDSAIRSSVVERHQHSFLVQSQNARDAILLPPNPCKPLNFGPLGALE